MSAGLKPSQILERRAREKPSRCKLHSCLQITVGRSTQVWLTQTDASDSEHLPRYFLMFSSRVFGVARGSSLGPISGS